MAAPPLYPPNVQAPPLQPVPPLDPSVPPPWIGPQGPTGRPARGQMARLEQRLAELEPSPNGQVDDVPEVIAS
jgi:hypothetical protein